MLTRRFREARVRRVASKAALDALRSSATSLQVAEWTALEVKARDERRTTLSVMASYEVQLQKSERAWI